MLSHLNLHSLLTTNLVTSPDYDLFGKCVWNSPWNQNFILLFKDRYSHPISSQTVSILVCSQNMKMVSQGFFQFESSASEHYFFRFLRARFRPISSHDLVPIPWSFPTFIHRLTFSIINSNIINRALCVPHKWSLCGQWHIRCLVIGFHGMKLDFCAMIGHVAEPLFLKSSFICICPRNLWQKNVWLPTSVSLGFNT